MLDLSGPKLEWVHQMEKLLGQPCSLPGSLTADPNHIGPVVPGARRSYFLGHSWEGPAGVCSEWSSLRGAPLIVWEPGQVQSLSLIMKPGAGSWHLYMGVGRDLRDSFSYSNISIGLFLSFCYCKQSCCEHSRTSLQCTCTEGSLGHILQVELLN